ncbi:hypothetical protein B0H16DRAFT_581967 [Mycena metata]|uniref:Uncharacterized protein n=1 Tax=Mycena metata TaxID=1033252 RepID=A0AAD7MDT4_9AGAR|nr:hypothetical protein B0H16DRAFT_581967 [Mycena metata]
MTPDFGLSLSQGQGAGQSPMTEDELVIRPTSRRRGPLRTMTTIWGWRASRTPKKLRTPGLTTTTAMATPTSRVLRTPHTPCAAPRTSQPLTQARPPRPQLDHTPPRRALRPQRRTCGRCRERQRQDRGRGVCGARGGRQLRRRGQGDWNRGRVGRPCGLAVARRGLRLPPRPWLCRRRSRRARRQRARGRALLLSRSKKAVPVLSVHYLLPLSVSVGTGDAMPAAPPHEGERQREGNVTVSRASGGVTGPRDDGGRTQSGGVLDLHPYIFREHVDFPHYLRIYVR